MSDGLIQVVGNGAREDIPTEVVGGNLCLYRFTKVKERGGGVIQCLDIKNKVEVDRGVWVNTCRELMVAVYKGKNCCSYGGMNMVRGEGE